jgi:hypothetical protein
MGMPHTQKLIIVSLALIAGIGLGFVLSKLITTENTTSYHSSPTLPPLSVEGDFEAALLPLLEARFGSTTPGFDSHHIMYVYKGILFEDFDGVETVSGRYQVKDDHLWHIASSTETISEVLTEAGFVTLYKNIRTRLAVSAESSVEALAVQLETISEPSAPEEPPSIPPDDSDAPVASPEEPTMCPMDAKQCPDGSFVGRTAPGCAFAACPDGDAPTNGPLSCTPTEREAEVCAEIYAPVCASYQVECITTPCEPIPKTYSNRCFACADNNVITFEEGACEMPRVE